MKENPPNSDLQRHVEEYYGTTLQQSSDLQTHACCVSEEPSPWIQERDTNDGEFVCGDTLEAQQYNINTTNDSKGSGC